MSPLEARVFWLEKALHTNGEILRAMYSFINSDLHPGFSGEIDKMIEEMDDRVRESQVLAHEETLDDDYFVRRGM